MRISYFLRVISAALMVLGLTMAATLVWSTRLLERATNTLVVTIESIRATEELEVSLLTLEGAREGVEAEDRDRAEAAVHRWLDEVSQFVDNDEEQEIYERAQDRVTAYLRAAPAARTESLNRALDSTESLVAINVAQARLSREQARRIQDQSAALGIAAIALLGLGLGSVVLLTRRFLYRPLERLRLALERYRHRRQTRLEQKGPTELKEIATQFNVLADALEQQQASQLRFLAGVAHDLRTPLGALKLAASGTLRSPSLPPEDKIRQLLSVMVSQVDRMHRMLEDLLDRTRIESGELELRKAPMDLRDIASEVVSLHRGVSEQHELYVEVPDQPVMALADPTRLAQVVTNLVNNAIKYSPRGGRVDVCVRSVDGVVEIAVSDEGDGIPLAEQERIFEPFRRTVASRANIPGVGLGLSVSRRIVHAHGGEILLESTVGRGSTFRVRLPRFLGATGEAPIEQAMH